jgi:hypothetical protein
LPNVRWVALRLLEGDATLEQAVLDHSLGDLSQQKAVTPANGIITLEAVPS